jgi:hypothetical protein
VRRFAITMVAAASLLAPASAHAVPPTLGPVSATNIQGVSALLKGTVDPKGLATTYRFEYATQASFAGAVKTATTTVGSGGETEPARAAISGLTPNTTYHYRLVATNSSGTTTGTASSFKTTAGFGFLAGDAGFSASAPADGGSLATLASSHPYRLGFTVGLKAGGEFEDQPGIPFPDGDLRDLRIEMPPGLILNPSVVEECTAGDFNTRRVSPFDDESRTGENCPDKTQVGTVEVKTSLGGGEARRFGLFNLVPAPGVAAQLGFAPYGQQAILDLGLRPSPDGSYVLTLEAEDMPQSLDLSGLLRIDLWGTPWGASHNGERGVCLNEAEPQFPWAKCSVGEPTTFPPLAYLTLPVTCQPTLSFSVIASSWQQPARVSRTAQNRDSKGQPVALGSCATASFAPQPEGFLTTAKASTPSGFNFRLKADNETLTNPTFRAPSSVKRAVVRLPAGVTINPSVGAGLGTCNPSQFAAETAFNPQGGACPNGAKIGDFSVKTPLFEGFLDGAIYLATPNDPGAPGAENPFNSLVAIYLVAKLPERGVLVKLAGRIDPNPSDGTITATFDGLPQLPYTDLNVNFRTGQRSFLVSPPACGPANTGIELAPWSGGPNHNHVTGSQITSGIDAGPCPSGTPPFTPDAITGGVNSNVNSYTPYYVHLTRKDTEQEITSYSLILPKGITGKLAGIPFCPEAAIAAARANRGFAEAANPSCPSASQVGRTLTGYGVGSSLTYASGRIYLAGPHNGSPLSLVTVNSATVGPFDLGTIVIRSAFDVDPHTAQLQIDSSASDPIPHIIDGIPLHLRDIRVFMDRPEFTHNPSSCEASQLISTLTGSGATFANRADDSTATIKKHFQLLNCLTLGFKPKLGLRLRGGSRRGAFPSLRATFAARGPQDSNLKRIEVTMPHSLFLAQNHIRAVCTKVQFNTGRCPADSVYGKAVAHTPLFDTPLRGDVYLRSSTNRLPDLVADLYSGAIRIIVEGKIGPAKHGIRAFFDELPDEPLNRFVMTLHGGRRGLLVNSSNLCASPPLAAVKALGQNNKGAIFTTALRGQCGGKKGVKR